MLYTVLWYAVPHRGFGFRAIAVAEQAGERRFEVPESIGRLPGLSFPIIPLGIWAYICYSSTYGYSHAADCIPRRYSTRAYSTWKAIVLEIVPQVCGFFFQQPAGRPCLCGRHGWNNPEQRSRMDQIPRSGYSLVDSLDRLMNELLRPSYGFVQEL